MQGDESAALRDIIEQGLFLRLGHLHVIGVEHHGVEVAHILEIDGLDFVRIEDVHTRCIQRRNDLLRAVCGLVMSVVAEKQDGQGGFVVRLWRRRGGGGGAENDGERRRMPVRGVK